MQLYEKVTRWFSQLANFVKVNIQEIPWNVCICLHKFFFSATILQYKQLKIEFYFSNESYCRHAVFSLYQAQENNCIQSASFFFLTLAFTQIQLYQIRELYKIFFYFSVEFFYCEFFCLMEHFSFCCYIYIKCNNVQKELKDIIN